MTARARKRRRIWRRRILDNLASDGVLARMGAANAVASETSGDPVFWKMLRDRIAAAEALAPITTPDRVQRIAAGCLRDLGVDLTDLQLKIDWQPPHLKVRAVPSAERAIAAAEQEAARG